MNQHPQANSVTRRAVAALSMAGTMGMTMASMMPHFMFGHDMIGRGSKYNLAAHTRWQNKRQPKLTANQKYRLERLKIERSAV